MASMPLFIHCSSQVADWLEAHEAEEATLGLFVGLMVTELAANDGKGNRPGWLTMDRKEALAEVHWHASKLAVAAKAAATDARGAQLVNKREAERDTREYAADVANCALMVLDCMGLLDLPESETA